MTAIPDTMHGVQLVKYGSFEEALVYNEEIPIPKIKSKTQVLVRIKAASVNPIEAKVASGNMKLGTFAVGLPSILGADFSGVIIAKGDKVTDFEVGDEVFGSQELPFGMNGVYAQYTTVETTGASIAKKPKELSFEQAASAGIAVLTAYQAIVNYGRITKNNSKEKRNILVVGASGGVGSYGIQVAKAINTENNVIGICSAKNVEFVESLGADRVINYRDEESYKSFLDEKIPFDIIFDCVGGDEYYKQLDPLLTKKGVYSTAVGPVAHAGSSYLGVVDVFSLVGNIVYKKLFGCHRYAMVTELPHNEFRTKIAPLFDNHKIHGTVYDDDNIFPLREISKAFEKIWSHRAVGKIVISID
ncbi:chaperonin 10-like protein [Thamnidium elegans]|nr:chaperonin 10-like protein [Thamnidium elegans]